MMGSGRGGRSSQNDSKQRGGYFEGGEEEPQRLNLRRERLGGNRAGLREEAYSLPSPLPERRGRRPKVTLSLVLERVRGDRIGCNECGKLDCRRLSIKKGKRPTGEGKTNLYPQDFRGVEKRLSYRGPGQVNWGKGIWGVLTREGGEETKN